MTHLIYHSLDKDLDVRSVFLDIFKAFDKERHDGLIFKLCKIEILGKKHMVLPISSKTFFKSHKLQCCF